MWVSLTIVKLSKQAIKAWLKLKPGQIVFTWGFDIIMGRWAYYFPFAVAVRIVEEWKDWIITWVSTLFSKYCFIVSQRTVILFSTYCFKFGPRSLYKGFDSLFICGLSRSESVAHHKKSRLLFTSKYCLLEWKYCCFSQRTVAFHWKHCSTKVLFLQSTASKYWCV